ncbi:DUF92 domain-containing protein [Bacillus sp. HMF5848]|uniref:DUF92 domain-containing protein n=1 Tax=Bacillus sp. HMF5848 TaxID=2495421 RepID=UPI000F79CE51|nr:DUF92 domain-containing protein [Bacillus sp. HMF5848]RSK27847.1 DUF92 domain-containing protein [Bacillus sp. HMF5848]
MQIELIISLAIVVFSVLGWKEKLLSLSGVLGASIVGITIYMSFSLEGLILLGLFFATSSFWSVYKKRQKSFLKDKLEKGEQRDIYQVFANGGIASILAIVYFFYPSQAILISFITSLAAANADTWASEIGTLSRANPILLHNGKRVAKGTSGAVSPLGTFASYIGALVIALGGAILWYGQLSLFQVITITTIGFWGSIIDTILGATIQVRYKCSICSIQTERKYHCEQLTIKTGGFVSVNNDAVNLLSNGIACITVLIFIYIQ